MGNSVHSFEQCTTSTTQLGFCNENWLGHPHSLTFSRCSASRLAIHEHLALLYTGKFRLSFVKRATNLNVMGLMPTKKPNISRPFHELNLEGETINDVLIQRRIKVSDRNQLYLGVQSTIERSVFFKLWPPMPLIPQTFSRHLQGGETTNKQRANS